MTYYLAVDIGASSGRHVLGWLENGKMRAEEIYRFANRPDERGGRLVWDTERLFGEIIAGLKAAAATPPSFVGIDTWAVDYALLGADDRPVGPVYCYRDSRGAAAARRVHEILPFETLYSRTGIQYQPFNTLYQLYDDKLTGRLDEAESLLMLPDYLGFLLTGIKRQEYTNATSTGLVAAASHVWDDYLLSELKFPSKLFTPLSRPGTAVGGFKAEIARQIGYEAALSLPATHDTASAVLAAPLHENSAYISSGTWSLLGVEQPAARLDESSRRFNFSNEGSTDFGFRYQKNIMGLWMIQCVRRETGDKYSFAQLAEMAEKQPTPLTVDVDDGRFLAPESMTKEIESAVGRRLDLGSLAYCIYNSLAQSYKKSLTQIERITGQSLERVNVVGGGCNNNLLNRLTAKACGKKVIAGPSEATAIGNLIVQMTAAGDIESLRAARKIVEQSFDVKEVEL